MIGAGVFAVWSPAIEVAGSGIFIALAIAAVVAYCNATSSAQLAAVPHADPPPLQTPVAYGVLQGAGLLFFAFAGYARIATLGEEVRRPAQTIPRAILIALSSVVVLYAVVGGFVIRILGADAVSSVAPLADIAHVAGWSWAAPAIRVAAATASLGALLALITGIGRTSLAMAREGDLPRFFAAVSARWHTPARAEIAVGLIIIAIVLVADLRGAIGFSSFGVLLYYLIANAAAFRQEGNARRYPRWMQALGATGCLLLWAMLPPLASLIGTGVILVGIAYRFVRLRLSR